MLKVFGVTAAAVILRLGKSPGNTDRQTAFGNKKGRRLNNNILSASGPCHSQFAPLIHSQHLIHSKNSYLVIYTNQYKPLFCHLLNMPHH